MALALVAVVAGLFRFFDPGRWPVFIDEDGYTWAAFQVMDAPWREALARVRDVLPEKTPWIPVIQGTVATLLAIDPLTSGRLLSAVAGTATTLLTFALGRRLADSTVGLLAATLYALSPVAILHERMALLDGLMCAAVLGAVVVGWAAVDARCTPLAVASALLGALAVQFKVPAVLTAAMPPALFLAASIRDRRRAGLAAVMMSGPVASYVALMASPLGRGLSDQNHHLLDLLGSFWPNVFELGDALATYFPFGLAPLAMLGLVVRGARCDPPSSSRPRSSSGVRRGCC